jgi:hypothetical protein
VDRKGEGGMGMEGKGGVEEVKELQIKFLERKLGKFPESYRSFIKINDGCAIVDGYRMLGIPTKNARNWKIKSVIEGTQYLRLRRSDLPKTLVTISIKGTKALCLDLEKGNDEDAPLVEVDLQSNIPPKPLNKTFREWRELHEAVAKRFLIARNRLKARRMEREGKRIGDWHTIINRVQDYVIGLAAFRYNFIEGCLEVDEFYPLDQPHIKKGEAVKVLLNEIFARARDYGGSLKVIFTRDARENELGEIPQEHQNLPQKRVPKPVPEELVNLAKRYGIAFKEADKGIISHEEGVNLWFASLELPPKVEERIYKLEEGGYLSREIVAEIVSRGVWTKEELCWIFLNAPRPEALLLGTDPPEDRPFYSESLNYGRAALLATRFREAIIAELTKGVSVEEIEKERVECVLEPLERFWILKCNRDFSLPRSWAIDRLEKPVKAREPVLLLCRPCFPTTPENDEKQIEEDLSFLLKSDAKADIKCLLLSYEFISPDYNNNVNKVMEMVKKANGKGINVLFAPSRMDLFLDEEIQKRMRKARSFRRFPQRRGKLKLQIIEVPSEWWEVPENLPISRAIQNASKSAKVFAEQIASNRDIYHYRMEFSHMCEVIEREALRNGKIIAELDGEDSEAFLEALGSDEEYKGVIFPYVTPEEMPRFLEKVKRSGNGNLLSLFDKVRGGIVVVVKPWEPLPFLPVKGETKEVRVVFKLPDEVKERIDAERRKRKYIGSLEEIERAHEKLREALENGSPLSMASIRSHVFVQVIRDYIYRLFETEPKGLRITYSDGTEGKPFPLFTLPLIEKPKGRFYYYPVGLVSLRHMKDDKYIQRSLIRNREIQLKETSADQEDLAFRRTYEHVEELLRFLKGEVEESKISLGLRALLIREKRLRDEQWEGLELHVFQSTGLEPACVGAYRAMVELLRKYRTQLVVVPVIIREKGWREAEAWY